MILTFQPNLAVLGMTWISKHVDEKVRGTVFSLVGASVSIGTSCFQAGGGYLYSYSRMALFMLLLIVNGILVSWILIVWKMKKF